jgi:Ca2+-transporting ATPase
VQDLLGRDALARWIEAHASAAGLTGVRASAATGLVRIAGRGAAVDRAQWQARLEAWVAAFGPAASPLPPPRSRRTAGAPPRARRSIGGAPRRPDRSGSPAAGANSPVRSAHAIDASALLTTLGTGPEGLSTGESQRRLERDGPNEIADVAARRDLDILLDQFKSVPVALLAGSAGLALATRAVGDAAAIAAVLAANSGVGFWTERSAERTVSSLRRLAPRTAVVLRDGRRAEIPAREVVVGDVLLLSPGEPIAADARVIDAHRLSTNEAALTGESLPVRKEPVDSLPADVPLGERRNMVHLGSVVSGGNGRAVVTAVAEATELGAIRRLAQRAEAPRTRLQQELDGLGKRLAIGASGLCLGIFAIGLLRGRPLLPLLRSAVSLGVAAIPEGLPTVATSLLASGIRSLRVRQVYARRLDAVENLGAVDVVGFDKTGTLTENRMTVAEICVGRNRFAVTDATPGGLRLPPQWAMVAVLCNELTHEDGEWHGSSTERALVEFAAHGAGADVAGLRRRHPRIAAKQRSEHHPYMVTLHADAGSERFVAVKGSPPEVLARCTRWHDGRRVREVDDATRHALLQENARLAASGHRVLALAYRGQRATTLGTTGGLVWLGLVGLADPVRSGVSESIRRFKAAGIRPLMLTGDQLGTASAVAVRVGLGTPAGVVDAATLPEKAEELDDRVEEAAAFARTTPGMKLEIIRALQARGHVVAMTGDGINDGPALKMADVGAAMGASGSDFAHAMSDLVLQSDHPDGLLEAIAEGRTAYLNVRKAVRYLVATNLSELAVMTGAMALGLPDPFDPLALLWINLITDVSPAIALGLEPAEPDILERPPFARTGALLGPEDWRRAAVDAATMTGATLASFGYGLSRYGNGPRARTLAFMTLTSAQLLYAYASRSDSRLDDARLARNRLLDIVLAASLALQAGTVLLPPLRGLLRTTPVGGLDLAVIAATAVGPALVRELAKRRGAARRGRGAVA